MRWLYLLFALFGVGAPCYFFISFVVENGLNVGSDVKLCFANNLSMCFAVDLLMTAIVCEYSRGPKRAVSEGQLLALDPGDFAGRALCCNSALFNSTRTLIDRFPSAIGERQPLTSQSRPKMVG